MKYNSEFELLTTEKCPLCGGQIVEYHTPNGEDDYTKHWRCLSCGKEWDE